jgi:hypothetical protein
MIINNTRMTGQGAKKNEWRKIDEGKTKENAED